MRRIASLLLLAALAIALVAWAPARSADSYRVDALFDTARGVIPGQVVKIAGARVGAIDDVQLTRDYKARIVMDVPREFSFREDASCSIQPEGLISENFVQCDPGTPGKPPLKGTQEGGAPTVPVDRTTVPVGLTDLFRIFRADIRQRFTVAMAALGGGLAGRGDDLNAIIERADPTLASVRRLTRTLARQKREIGAVVRDSDRLVAELAKRKDRVQDFIVQSRRVSERTASRRRELAESIRRLPALLDASRPADAQLDDLVVRARPLLGDLRAAATPLSQALDATIPFSAAAKPALQRLSHTADLGLKAARSAGPVVKLLRRFAKTANPSGKLLASLLVSLRDRGFVEYLESFTYFATAGTARYDATSHILPAHPIFNSCGLYAQTPAADCNAFYRKPAAAKQQRDRAHSKARSPQQQPEASKPKTPRTPSLTLPKVPDLTDRLPDLPPVDQIVDQLVSGASVQGLQDLADFLLTP